MSSPQTNSSRWRWPIIIGFVVASAIVVLLMAGSLWQSSIANSREGEAEDYEARATLLEEAGAEGESAATLLQTYVQEGDITLLPQVDEHSTIALEKLTAALSQEGASDVAAIVTSASNLVDGVAQVVTLRQSGEVASAAAALDQMSVQFEQLTETQDAAIDAERAAAADARSDADSADARAGTLGAASLAIAGCILLTALILVTRSLMSRRASRRASTT